MEPSTSDTMNLILQRVSGLVFSKLSEFYFVCDSYFILATLLPGCVCSNVVMV